MEIVSWLLLLPVAVFPYSLFLFPFRDFGTVELYWLIGLAGALLLFLTRRGWDARKMALSGMVVKLVQIPAYITWFVLGIAMFLFMGPLLSFLMDTMTIILSGLVGLAAVLRCKREGILTGKQALLHGVLQFIFCADVVSAIILYRKTKEVSK